MKGEYVEEEKDIHSSMFAQLQQAQKFQNRRQPTPNLQQPPAFQLPTVADPSEEVDSHHHHHLSPSTSIRDPPTQTVPLLPPPTAPFSGNNDGATIEVVRRPRGRPPGSKNKPKPPVIITREAEPSMSPYVLELPAGIDIVETIVSFCREKKMGLCVLNGSGAVTNVTVRQPSTTPCASVTFHGRFDILSLSATILARDLGVFNGDSGGIANEFTISLAGPQGQVVGGAIVGHLYSAGTVYLIAASFSTPMFHRLPLEDERNSGSPRSGGNDQGSQPSPVSGGSDSAAAAGAGVEGLGLYNLPSDVIWAPAARQPPQRPPPY